jgi:hypothetical protein
MCKQKVIHAIVWYSFIIRGPRESNAILKQINQEAICSVALPELSNPLLFADSNCIYFYANLFACNEKEEQTSIHEVFYGKMGQIMHSSMKTLVTNPIMNAHYYQKAILPWILDLFQTPDVNIRLVLLELLPIYLLHISPDKIKTLLIPEVKKEGEGEGGEGGVQ